MASSSTLLSQDRLPDWLAEALDVLGARRRLVVAVAIGLVLVGAIVSLVAPTILPARAIVGVAVGVAAALLATALALALDASDLVVRGARHVRAAGGAVDVRVGRPHDDVGPLLAAVARHAADGAVRVALTPASRSAAVPGPRAAALAESIARTGRRVLLTDLTRGGSPAAGLSDVVAGERSLSEVVRFEQDLYLARLAVGSDPDLAIRRFPTFVEALPDDLEVLVVALPPLAEPGVLGAVEAFDLTLVLVEVDRTERVDLIASLDAMDAAQATSELVLIDPTAGGAHERRPDTATAPDTTEDDASEPDATEADAADVDADEDEATRVGSTATDDLVLEEPEAEAPEPREPDATDAHVPGADAPRPDVPDAPETQDEEAAAELASLLHDEDLDDSPVADTPDEDRHVTTEPPADETDEIRIVPTPAASAGPDTGTEPPTEPPTTAPEPEGRRDAGASTVPGDASAADPAPTPDPAPARTPDPEPATVGAPRTAAAPDAPDRAPSWITAPRVPADQYDEDVALEVARTSAALQQLAQQVWQRQSN